MTQQIRFDYLNLPSRYLAYFAILIFLSQKKLCFACAAVDNRRTSFSHENSIHTP